MRKHRPLALYLLFLTAGVLVSAIQFNCGQIAMPVGGPKDSIPPVLTSASPQNNSLEFNSRRITLNFNEYIELDNAFKNVLVSPVPRKTPVFDYKLRTVTVRLFDTLLPNTTYTIQFGKAIKDLNEGNVLKDFVYTFSTGKYIDSLTLGGRVMLAETGTVDSTLVVMLYNVHTDSAVYKQKPKYIARLDGKGNFHFRNLPPDNYQIFALKDESGQLMYNNPLQLFAFSDSLVALKGQDHAPVNLFAYSEEKPQPKVAAQKTEPELKYATSLVSGRQDLLTPLVLTFNNPLQSFDSTKLLLTDTSYIPVRGVGYSLDSTQKKLTLTYPWKEGSQLQLLVLDGAATDTLGAKYKKSDTLKLAVKNESDYGSVKLNFKNFDKFSHPVLQLLNDQNTMQSFPLKSAVFELRLINPGTYTIQILEDSNENGVWDPGKYEARKQPERVQRITQKLSVRANWDNELDIEL
ncbi:MAG: Ig-like domain-containing protein [Chitinophagaceae bacterium]|nr:Ig-like domain-containing protein [Chitinophagaceae bacterium]